MNTDAGVPNPDCHRANGCCANAMRRPLAAGTDHIDIYHLHRDFEEDSLEEVAAALGDLIRSGGKIRYFGISNFRAWRIAEVAAECKRQGVPTGHLPAVPQILLNRLAPRWRSCPRAAFRRSRRRAVQPDSAACSPAKYKPGDEPPPDSRAAPTAASCKPNGGRNRW